MVFLNLNFYNVGLDHYHSHSGFHRTGHEIQSGESCVKPTVLSEFRCVFSHPNSVEKCNVMLTFFLP